MDAQSPVIPLVEREVALDLVRHGLIIAPFVIVGAGAIGGADGAASAAIGLGIMMLNFLSAAAITSWASRRSTTAVGVASIIGYVVRLLVVLVALFALQHVSWIDLPTLGIVLVGSHLGLLFWEMKHVSITLAAPGLRPARPSGDQ